MQIFRVVVGQEVPRLHGVLILSLKEAKGTFLTPVRGNMIFFSSQIILYGPNEALGKFSES